MLLVFTFSFFYQWLIVHSFLIFFTALRCSVLFRWGGIESFLPSGTGQTGGFCPGCGSKSTGFLRQLFRCKHKIFLFIIEFHESENISFESLISIRFFFPSLSLSFPIFLFLSFSLFFNFLFFFEIFSHFFFSFFYLFSSTFFISFSSISLSSKVPYPLPKLDMICITEFAMVRHEIEMFCHFLH